VFAIFREKKKYHGRRTYVDAITVKGREDSHCFLDSLNYAYCFFTCDYISWHEKSLRQMEANEKL